MTSPDSGSSPRLAILTRVEETYLNLDGGRGWVEEYWSVCTNDGWTSVGQLLHRRSVGGVTAVEERFDHLPAGRRAYRVVTIHAPVGTLVMHRVRRSELSGEQKTILVLVGDEKLARPHEPGAEVAPRARTSRPPQRLPLEAVRAHAGALLAAIEPAPEPEPATEPEDVAPSVAPGRAAVRRHRAVELRRPPPPPADQEEDEKTTKLA